MALISGPGAAISVQLNIHHVKEPMISAIEYARIDDTMGPATN